MGNNIKDFRKYISADRLSKFAFIFSCSILIFGYGYIAHMYKIFPYNIISRGIAKFELYSSQKRLHYLVPIVHKESGVKIHKPDKVMPGVTLLASFWPETQWSAGAKLINIQGEVLHHWKVNASEIWPESPHNDWIKNRKNVKDNYIHGTHLYPNGDIIINIEYMGLVRMNSISEILWKLPYRTHHSVFIDESGNLWVCGFKWIEEGNDRVKDLPGLKVPYIEETILKVSPEGEILDEISVLEALYEGNYQHLLYHYGQVKRDGMHLNDVEVISSKLAEDYELFDPGDIVVSLRDIHSIAVLNPKGEIIWMNNGVFTRQHDPDFEEDGWITVFDNRTDIPGKRSQIKRINPDLEEVQTLYPTQNDQFFYTGAGGKHQELNNGNRLITETQAGRIFEVSPQGETVWEWINQPYDDKFVAEVFEGTKYDIEERIIANWKKVDLSAK